MNHSITAFDRKYLSPDFTTYNARKAQRRQNRLIALFVLAVIALTAFHYFVLPELLHSIAPDIF